MTGPQGSAAASAAASAVVCDIDSAAAEVGVTLGGRYCSQASLGRCCPG